MDSITITLLIIGFGSFSTGKRIVDLSHPLNSRSMHYQLFRDFELKPALKGNQEGLNGMWVEANDISLNEHTGTHVDAPIHTWETGMHIDEIPAEKLVSPAAIIDVTEQQKTNPDYTLTVEDIQSFEEAKGKIPDQAVVFIFTDGAKDYGNHSAYLGTADPKDSHHMHYPGFSAESVKWLVDNRDIRGIGTDRMSFDAGQNGNKFPAHIAILSRGRFGIENTNNLDQVPALGATVYVMVLPIEGGSGSPARIVAVVDESNTAVGLRLVSLSFLTTLLGGFSVHIF